MTQTIHFFQSVEFFLVNYRNGIIDSTSSPTGLVGEFFAEDTASMQARLLCQTRCIFFLAEYHRLFNCEETLSHALSLYNNTRRLYHKKNGWHKWVNDTSATDDLYELAFVGYAFSALYAVHKDDAIAHDAMSMFTHLSNLIQKRDFFPNCVQYQGFTSQNPMMHLYESFIMGYQVFQIKPYADIANLLLEMVDTHFFCAASGKINEVLAPNNQTPWSEPGHAFEWVSLLLESQDCAIENLSRLKPLSLLKVAEENGVNAQGFVKSQFETIGTMEDTTHRIWPQLERARAYFALKKIDQGLRCAQHIASHFFTPQGLPLEYFDKNYTNNQKVKTTTGYHIINCLKHVIEQSFI